MDTGTAPRNKRVTPAMGPPPVGRAFTRRQLTSIGLGVVVAVGIPVIQIIVAFVWQQGIVRLEPNGPFVQTLQSGSSVQLLLGPIGVAIVGIGARLRSWAPWVLLVVVAVPVLAVLWFVGAAWLGGLAGEPF
jgi:hypothetical protein